MIAYLHTPISSPAYTAFLTIHHLMARPNPSNIYSAFIPSGMLNLTNGLTVRNLTGCQN